MRDKEDIDGTPCTGPITGRVSSLISENDLDAYLLGKADDKLCRLIENDPGYREWIEDDREEDWNPEHENRVHRILQKVNNIFGCKLEH